MKQSTVIHVATIIVMSLLISCSSQNSNTGNGRDGKTEFVIDSTDATNNFYDNEKTYLLPGPEVMVVGEVKNPGIADFSTLPIHSVIVKEALLDEDGDRFTGAYRYDGYSLLDILNTFQLDKKNAGEFKPIIDLFVEIENNKGEKIVLSWGEIFYPNHLHEIIIATRVMRIVPSKTQELWHLPTEAKLVVAGDLITERNITAPSKITVKSYPKSFKVTKGMKPVYAKEFELFVENKPQITLSSEPKGLVRQTYPAIFYGRGRGIHSTQPFNGFMLKGLLGKYTNRSRESLRQGIFLVTAEDGYRGVFTYSEIMNRNDQSEVLLIYIPNDKHGGAFRLFPAGDFFSDRAIMAIKGIYYSENEQ